MEKWLKIEKLLNNLLTMIGTKTRAFINVLTPNKIKNTIETSQKNLESKKQNLKKTVHNKSQVFIEKARVTKKITQDKVSSVQTKTKEGIKKAKTFKLKDLDWKKILIVIFAIFAPALTKLKSLFTSIQPQTLAAAITLSTIGALTSLNIYKETSSIAEKQKAESGKLVEKVEGGTVVSKRPGYFRKKQRQFRLNNIILPAYFDENQGIRKLVIDFTIESSNQYIKTYFWENPHLIRDVLNSQIAPISIDFPLKDEGKVIIKEKILLELKKLLQSKQVKGDIKEIYVHSVIGG